jgi:hypothetical protein
MTDLKTQKNPKDKLDVFIKQWVKQGLIWGAIMYALLTFVFPMLDDEPIQIKRALINIPVMAIAGLGYGYLMKMYATWAKKKK